MLIRNKLNNNIEFKQKWFTRCISIGTVKFENSKFGFYITTVVTNITTVLIDIYA